MTATIDPLSFLSSLESWEPIIAWFAAIVVLLGVVPAFLRRQEPVRPPQGIDLLQEKVRVMQAQLDRMEKAQLDMTEKRFDGEPAEREIGLALALLGLPPSSLPADDALRRASREKLRVTHPDKGGDPDLFQQVLIATEVITAAKEKARHRGW